MSSTLLWTMIVLVILPTTYYGSGMLKLISPRNPCRLSRLRRPEGTQNKASVLQEFVLSKNQNLTSVPEGQKIVDNSAKKRK